MAEVLKVSVNGGADVTISPFTTSTDIDVNDEGYYPVTNIVDTYIPVLNAMRIRHYIDYGDPAEAMAESVKYFGWNLPEVLVGEINGQNGLTINSGTKISEIINDVRYGLYMPRKMDTLGSLTAGYMYLLKHEMEDLLNTAYLHFGVKIDFTTDSTVKTKYIGFDYNATQYTVAGVAVGAVTRAGVGGGDVVDPKPPELINLNVGLFTNYGAYLSDTKWAAIYTGADAATNIVITPVAWLGTLTDDVPTSGAIFTVNPYSTDAEGTITVSKPALHNNSVIKIANKDALNIDAYDNHGWVADYDADSADDTSIRITVTAGVTVGS